MSGLICKCWFHYIEPELSFDGSCAALFQQFFFWHMVHWCCRSRIRLQQMIFLEGSCLTYLKFHNGSLLRAHCPHSGISWRQKMEREELEVLPESCNAHQAHQAQFAWWALLWNRSKLAVHIGGNFWSRILNCKAAVERSAEACQILLRVCWRALWVNIKVFICLRATVLGIY